MRFVRTTGGRSKSTHPKERADCTVRALAVCLQIPYDEAYRQLEARGRKPRHAFDLEACARKTIFDSSFGPVYFRLHKMALQKGATRRYRLEDFCRDNPKGHFIVGTASHVMAVVNGNPHDDLPYHFNENRPVYSWLVPWSVTAWGSLWRVYALRAPIKKGRPRFKRAVGIVAGNTYRAAMKTAGEWYEAAIRPNEDLEVERFQDASNR